MVVRTAVRTTLGTLQNTAVATMLAWLGASAAEAQAGPAAVAEERVDVDGDGHADTIRIDNPPAVTITLATPNSQPGTPIWKPFAAAVGTPVGGRISVGSGQAFAGRTVVVATVEFAGRKSRGPVGGRSARTGQAMILALTPASGPGRAGTVKVDTLWEGSVGAQGRDNEYRVRVEAAPFGLIRYQERADIRRCDGQPAYLFPQGFDFKRRKFRNIASPLRLPANAPTITATRAGPGQAPGTGAGRARGTIVTTPAVAFRSQSASAQAYAAHAGQLVPPRELDDGDPTTAWREQTGGFGRGLFITLTSPMNDPEIAALRFTPGDAATRADFIKGNRIRRLGVLIGDKHAFWIDVPTDPARLSEPRAPLFATLPEGIRGRCVTVLVSDVFQGRGAKSRRSGDTAISDLAVITDLDLSPGGPEAILIQQVIAGGATGDSAARMLQNRGPAAATAIVAALDGNGPDGTGGASDLAFDAALRLRRVLARLGLSAGAAQLAAGLAVADLSDGDERAFSRALARMGEAAIPALSSSLQDQQAATEGRIASAQVLAAMPGNSAFKALISACGVGDRSVRKAVSVGLGQRAISEVPALLAALDAAVTSNDRACEADLWRAIGLMARRAGNDAQTQIAGLLADRLGADVPHASVEYYELTYRLLDASGGLHNDIAVAAVTAVLKRLLERDSAHGRALRRVAASALARHPRHSARDTLITLADDTDPGVRMVAISGLGPRADADRSSDAVVVSRLAQDAWPGIRRAAASALGHRCASVESTRTALDRAVDEDKSIDVQREALTALVECRAPGIGARLLAVASDRKRAEKLRQRSLSLVPALDDPALVKPLIRLFGKLRQASWSDEKSVRLASAAAVAMGRTGDKRVVAPLMKAAREASFPEIQAGAVTGLGEMCPPQARRLFASLLGSDQRAVLVAARAAHNRCKR